MLMLFHYKIVELIKNHLFVIVLEIEQKMMMVIQPLNTELEGQIKKKKGEK